MTARLFYNDDKLRWWIRVYWQRRNESRFARHVCRSTLYELRRRNGR